MRTRALLLILLLLWPQHALAYLHFGFTFRGQEFTLRWEDRPVRWFATDRGVNGVSATQFQAAAARAFATWEGVPTASITFQFAGFTGAEPGADDNISVLGFQSVPELERTLAATGFIIDIFTGEIVESDIFFNSAFDWSTAAAGDPARFDLESVALHEIGHLIGLGHSAIGETERRFDGSRRVLGTAAVMFPISLGRGSIADRVLTPDDIAGASDLYPDGSFRADTGVARGTVQRNGAAAVGAHVVAFNVETGALVGAFVLDDDGGFEIAGLEPGPHIIRVEPLDDADVGSFFDDNDPIETRFGVTYYDRLFVAPGGGAGSRVVVSVAPR